MSAASITGPLPSATARSNTLRSSRTCRAVVFVHLLDSGGVDARGSCGVSARTASEKWPQQRQVRSCVRAGAGRGFRHLQAEEQVRAELAGWTAGPAVASSLPHATVHLDRQRCRPALVRGGLQGWQKLGLGARPSISPISSERSCRGAPPRADLLSVAQVNEPFSWPNSSISSRVRSARQVAA